VLEQLNTRAYGTKLAVLRSPRSDDDETD
jgi:hypothetical protein